MKFTVFEASSREHHNPACLVAHKQVSNVRDLSLFSPPDPISPAVAAQRAAYYHSESHPVDGTVAMSSADVVGIGRVDRVERSRCSDIARRGRLFGKRRTQRLVRKSGECNVTSVSVSNRKRKYVADTFTSLIEMRWTYHVVLFATLYLATWLAFGLVYYAIAVVHDDINQPTGNEATPQPTPCISNVVDYSSAFLFSLETQSTIGYGVRVVNPVCEFAVIVVAAQTIVGFFVQMLSCGLFFAKMSRPKGRAKTLLFSKSAAICQRPDGQYQLAFRVGDMRVNSHIVGSSIRALVVRNNLSDNEDGQLTPLFQQPLPLRIEDSDQLDATNLFMVWPSTIVHRIDESSPLWNVSADQLVAEQFEIIVILEGTVESTGSSTQVLTSYLPSEIHWGHVLKPLRAFRRHDGVYAVDYSSFHDTLPVVWMPDCSARTWSTSFVNSQNTHPSGFQNCAQDHLERTPDDVGSPQPTDINDGDINLLHHHHHQQQVVSRSNHQLGQVAAIEDCREHSGHNNGEGHSSKFTSGQRQGGNGNTVSRSAIKTLTI